MEIYREEDFYKKAGYPTEYLYYCDYCFIVSDGTSEYGQDYDQFALVKNSLYPYIRLTRKRGIYHFPNGGSSIIAIDGSFAKKSDAERDEDSPKIAWGLAAEFLAHLKYDSNQDDYVPKVELKVLIADYYKRYWELYKQNHNGLKYSKITIEKKELDFIKEHFEIERKLWEKSEPLRNYAVLYDYSDSVVKDYMSFLLGREQSIKKSLMPQKNSFSTEVKKVYETPYIEVYFLDDAIASDAKSVVENLNSVRKVNITLSNSKAHPGNTLTVYPKPMVSANDCQVEINVALKLFLSNVTIGSMKAHNEAFFAGIESQIIDALDKAEATINVCVAWFTNTRLRDKLIEKKKEGIDVKVIIYKDGVNHSKGVDLSQLPHKEFRGERGGIMHDKFCVIDNVTTICGSYNWTLNAENKNDEDASFHVEDYKFASKYTRRFNEMWNRDGF